MKTFDSFSFGCRVNQAEKESLDRELENIGLARKTVSPDIYVINTCAVTMKAEREARAHIYKFSRSNPDSKIIVTGCAATNWMKQGKEVDGVELLIDNKSKEFVAEIIQKKFSDTAISNTPKVNERLDELYPHASDVLSRSKRVMIKIQDGCHRFCSFCIVPYLRGIPQSTKIVDIVDKINKYPNFSEAILAAINTEAFGRDSNENIIDLIKSVTINTKIPRISFGSIHPWTITPEFIEYYKIIAGQGRFIDFFHIPLQSGSNKMLNLMKRGYAREEFIEKLHLIANIEPMAFIGTDVIVGFLEETDQDFADTYEFLDSTPISRLHVFRYSKREHTAGFHLSKRLKAVTPDDKKKRSQALRDLSNKKFEIFQNKHIGKELPALFLERREGEYQHVLLSNQMPAMIKTKIDFTGSIKRVKIESCRLSTLTGRLI